MKDKKIYPKVLRIIAFTFVMFNHTGEYGFGLFTTTDSAALRIFVIIIDNIVKCGVPIFLMISGSLLIPREEEVGVLLRKRVLRYVSVLAFISLVYYIRLYIKNPEYGFSLKYFIQLIYRQPFITPLWFLYIYIAFLIMLPLIRRTARAMSGRDYTYFFIVGMIMTYLPAVLNPFMEGTVYLGIPLLTVSFFYPVAGYYIDTLQVGNRKQAVMFAFKAMMINALLCLSATLISHARNDEWRYDYIEAFIMIPAFCIFFLIKTALSDARVNAKVNAVITYIGVRIFTVYLLEEMIREDIGMNIYRTWGGSCPLLLLFIPYAAVVLGIGVLFASVLRLIPGVKKFI